MQIYNKTTNAIVWLSYDPTRIGCDALPDLVSGDRSISWDEDREMRVADAGTIAWWEDWVSKSIEADQMEADLAVYVGRETAAEISIAAVDAVSDFGDQPQIRLKWLSDALAECQRRDYPPEHQHTTQTHHEKSIAL